MKVNMKKINALFCIMSFGFLTACEQFKSGLGLDHYQPDEFAIPTNPPLELPPNYKLRPPRTTDNEKTSSIHIKEQNPSDKAQEVIGIKKSSIQNQKKSSAKNNDNDSLIQKAKASAGD